VSTIQQLAAVALGDRVAWPSTYALPMLTRFYSIEMRQKRQAYILQRLPVCIIEEDLEVLL